MRPRTECAVLLLVLGLCSCAPARRVLLPSPPSEVRKETETGAKIPTVPPAPPPAPAVPVPPPVDYAKRYQAAIDRTRDAIARHAWKSALPAWSELETGPYRRDAVFHQGVLLQLAGDLNGAKSLYRTLAEENPPHEPSAANLLGILLLRGELADAGALAARLLPDPRTPPPGMLPELRANLAAVLAETGKSDDAARMIDSLQASGFDPPALTWNLAVLAFRKGDPATAKTLAANLPQETLSLFPVAASRAAWDPEAGNIPSVDNVSAVEGLLSLFARNLSAYRAFRGGRPAIAEAALRDADGDPEQPELLTNLGIVEVEQGKWKEARESFEEAVRKDPTLAAGWRNLGIYLEIFAGDPGEARRCYEKYATYHGVDREEVSKWAEWLGRPAPSFP